MASDFTVVTQYPTVEYLGGNQTRNVVAVGYNITQYSLYFEARIPSSVYSATQVNDYGIGYTATIISLLQIPGVTDGFWSQAPTSGGELEDQLTLTVTTASGNSSATITYPASKWSVQDVEPGVTALLNELTTAEGS